MRKLLISVLVALVLIVAALAIVPQFLDVNRYHDQIQAELSKRLGRQVSIGHLSLSLLPPSFKVENGVIFEDPAFNTGRPFAQARDLSIRVQLLPLLSKQLRIDSVTLDQPQIELVSNSAGVWNVSSLGAKKQPKEQGGQTELQLARLQINNGTIAIQNDRTHLQRSLYDHIDLTLRDYAKGKPFSVDLAAHLPGQGKQVARLSGKGGPVDEANLANTPFDGKVDLDQVSISGFHEFLNLEALEGTDATLTGSSNVKNENGRLKADGALKIADLRVRGNEIGYLISVDYDVSDDLTTDLIQINRGMVKLGSTPLDITGSLNTRSTPSLADLRIKANDVSIAEAARMAAAFGTGFNPGMQFAGRLNANIHAQGASSNPALNGNLDVRDLTITGKDLPAPVKIPAMQLALAPQQIRSNDFTASTGGTAVNVHFAMSQYTSKQPIVDAAVKMANANVGEVLNIAHAAGVGAVEGVSGTGLISLDLHAAGPVKNTELMDLSGSGNLQNASIRSAQLTQPVNVRNANLRFTKNSMLLDNLQAAVGSTNVSGNLTMQNFEAPQVRFVLNADKVNVAELEKLVATPAAQQNQPRRAALEIVPAANAQQRSMSEPSLINKMTGSGQVTVGQVIYDQLLLEQLKSNVQLNRGLITLSPVNAQLYGGSTNGTVTVDLRGQNTIYNVALKTQKVDSNKLLSSVSSAKDVLYGLLFTNSNALFASVPNGQNIASTLNGRVSLNMNNGRLANVDLLQQLSAVGKFQSIGRASQDFTNLQQLAGDFDVRNGMATTNNLKAVIEGGTLAATGSVNLVDESLNMRATAVLSKAYSQQVGGNSVGGYMQTALANNKGELVLPVIVSGSLKHPSFAPDVNAIAQMKMQNLLPSFSNPGQLSTGILGAVGGKQGQGQADTVGGIVDALSGRNVQKGQQQQQKTTTNSNPQQPQGNSTADTINDIVGGLFGGSNNKKKNQQQSQPQQ